MVSFDNIKKTANQLFVNLAKCPRCGHHMLINNAKNFPKMECEVCHLIIKLSTRNNRQIGLVIAYMGLLFVFFCGFLVGLMY